MPEPGIAGDQPAKVLHDIADHGWVCAFVDGHPGGGVGDKHAHKARESRLCLAYNGLDALSDVHEDLAFGGADGDIEKSTGHS